MRHIILLLVTTCLACGDNFGESMAPLPQEGPDSVPTSTPLERQGASARMAEDVRYPLVHEALKYAMDNGEFTSVAQHSKVRVDASRIFGGNYGNTPVRVNGRDYARYVAGDNTVAAIRDDEYIVSIRGLREVSSGRFRVSVGVGYMHTTHGWGGTLYELHLRQDDDGNWQVESMVAKVQT